MMAGSPVLLGDNTIPGVKIPDRIIEKYPKILKAVKDFGCDPYDSILEFLTYDEISEIASFSGFPVRYPHWKFGMEYEQMSRGFEFNMYRIFEMVINNDPSIIYCLDSNTYTDHVTVIAHALGHSDFFKNNIWFEPTIKNAVNQFANHGTRIRRYMDRWGKETVMQFIDWVLSIDDLIDPTQAWFRPKAKKVQYKDSRTYRFPRRLKLPETDGVIHDHMEEFINPRSWLDAEKDRIRHQEIMEELNIFKGGHKDILGYLVQNSPLTTWQADIASMLYREAQYFYPQRQTKTINEGWASYVDYNIMARQRWAGPEGFVHYAKHKTSVLGGKFSMNPYAIGFKLLLHIENKWNKGRFGREYEECKYAEKKKNWDTKVGLGLEKVFEVRALYNDVMFIHEFMDQEFVDEFEMYYTVKRPSKDRDGSFDWVIESRDAKVIKKRLLERYINGGRPNITLEDPNYGNKNLFLLQHQWDGRTLHKEFAVETLHAIWNIWNRGGVFKRNVALATKNKDEKEIVYICAGKNPENRGVVLRKDFEEQFG